MEKPAWQIWRGCLDGLIAILLLTVAAWGQGVIVAPQQVTGKVGAGLIPISNASITVCAANTLGIPCSPALIGALFKDAALTIPVTNPFFADSNGNYQFAIAPGQYTITTSAAGFAGYSYQLSVGAGANQVVYAATGTNVSTQGVLPSNGAAQNQSAFAAIATGVNAGTLSPYVFIPAGTYNISTTASTGLGVYTVPTTIHCENAQTTILNFSGTGRWAILGPTGLTTTSPYVWVPIVVENCQFTDNGSPNDGLYVPPEVWGVEIRYNYFHNAGNGVIYVIHGDSDTWIKVIGNNYLRTDGVAGNFARIGTPTSPNLYGLLEAYSNKVVCAISTTNPNSQPCGTGFASEMNLIAANNVMSGPTPLIRCGTGAGGSAPSNTLSCQISGNLLEVFGTGISFGTPGAAAPETISNMLVDHNLFVTTTAGTHPIQPASTFTILANSQFSNNIRRADSADNGILVTVNPVGNVGNSAFGNVGWSSLSSNETFNGMTGPNSISFCGELGIVSAGQCLTRNETLNSYTLFDLSPNGTGASNLTSGFQVFNTDFLSSSVNYENLFVGWNTNEAIINATKAGTGTQRAFGIQFGGADRFGFDTSGNPFITNAPVAKGTLSVSGTGACATTSTTAGGAWGGKLTCTGATGASTLVITFGSTGPNGSSCFGSDVTAKVAAAQSAIGTTTCTLNWATVTTNDVLTFGVIAW